MLRSVLLSACALFVVAASGGAQVSYGAGTQSCGQWLEARRTKSQSSFVRENMILSWVQGFLIGVAKEMTQERMIEDLAGRIARGDLPPNILDSDPQGRVLKIQQAKFGTVSGFVFDPPDSDALKGWIDKYCREHPLKIVSQASDALVDELSPPERPTPPAARKR